MDPDRDAEEQYEDDDSITWDDVTSLCQWTTNTCMNLCIRIE